MIHRSVAYTPKARETYDALADRFVRAVECALRYFRSREMQELAEQSDTTRTNLDRMEKLKLAYSAELWLAIRSIKNRIVHDYPPEQIAQIFDLIASGFGPGVKRLAAKLEDWSGASPSFARTDEIHTNSGVDRDGQ